MIWWRLSWLPLNLMQLRCCWQRGNYWCLSPMWLLLTGRQLCLWCLVVSDILLSSGWVITFPHSMLLSWLSEIDWHVNRSLLCEELKWHPWLWRFNVNSWWDLAMLCRQLWWLLWSTIQAVQVVGLLQMCYQFHTALAERMTDWWVRVWFLILAWACLEMTLGEVASGLPHPDYYID